MTFKTSSTLKKTPNPLTPPHNIQHKTFTNKVVKLFPKGLGNLYNLILCAYQGENM